MDSFEVFVDGELFRISERGGSSATISYDFSWLNGPANGTYGFSVGLVANQSAETETLDASEFSRERLIAEVQGFLHSFHEDGGNGYQPQ